MTTELYWLVLTCLMTGIFWIPYILNRILVRGLWVAMGNPTPDAKPHSPWASRAMGAHVNAVENLAVFAPLVLVAHAVGISNDVTAMASVVYFFARLGHFLVFVFGIPGFRTVTFIVAWLCQMAFALALLGLL